MNKLFAKAAVAAALTLTFCGAAFSQTVLNGGFEGGTTAGWNTPNGTDDMVILSGSTPYGNYFLELGGCGGGCGENSIDQLVSGFTIGQTYTLSFATASQWAQGSGAQVAVSFLSGSSTAAQVFTAPKVANWGAWQSFSYDFVATATSVDIQFRQKTNGFDDVGIDNINISAVPEPETYAMLLAGLGVMGAVARRRKAKQA